MEQSRIFSILDSVDSTNNYAMAQVHAGLAKPGMAWFANIQTAGKGQRGKAWQSTHGENITMSILVEPSLLNRPHPFIFSAAIALACTDFLQSLTKEKFKIKWPNDIYWCDRKAGGILVENIMQGKNWKWSVIGIGININQTIFNSDLKNPVSIKEITHKDHDPVDLAKQLHAFILNRIEMVSSSTIDTIMHNYNDVLYKKGSEVALRKNNIVFKTRIRQVDHYGHLITSDAIERCFTFGEVEWVINN